MHKIIGVPQAPRLQCATASILGDCNFRGSCRSGRHSGGVFHGGVSPHTSDLSASILVVLAALLGGVARIEGGLVGAIITVFLISFASQHTQRYWTFVGAVFVVVVMFMPNGLLGSKLHMPALYKK